MAMRHMILGRQAACMCVSVDSSHENCSYHPQIRVNLMEYRDLFFLHEYSGGIWVGVGVDLYSGKYGTQSTLLLSG